MICQPALNFKYRGLAEYAIIQTYVIDGNVLLRDDLDDFLRNQSACQ